MNPIARSADVLRSLDPTPMYLISDGGAQYVILPAGNLLEPNRSAADGFARSDRRSLFYYIQTGYSVSSRSYGSGLVRCKIVVARDPGYADDTVIFDDECESFGGWMPFMLSAPDDPKSRRQEATRAVTELASIAERCSDA